MEKFCCVCKRKIETEEPAVLSITPLGKPLHLCHECEALFERATLAREPEEISGAIDEIGETLTKADNADSFILSEIEPILAAARERGELIENGVYDFQNDLDEEEEAEGDVPEELLETEEDKELDRRDEEVQKKFDKIMNYVSIGLIAVLLVLFVYKLIDTFLL